MEAIPSPFFGAQKRLDIHQDKSGPSRGVCTHAVHYPGGPQVESWHLWTSVCSQMVVAVRGEEALARGDFPGDASQTGPHFGEHNLLAD